MSILNDFKTFLLRGNVVDLAVAIVIGVAFAAMITALVEGMLTPLIALIFGEPDFGALTFEINDSIFRYGDSLNAVVSFLAIAAAVFFFVVVPVNQLMRRYQNDPPPDPSIRKCPECLSDINAAASRCAYCTAQVTPAASA